MYYALIDDASANVLGEFATAEELEEFQHELREADPESAEHLRVVAVDRDPPRAWHVSIGGRAAHA